MSIFRNRRVVVHSRGIYASIEEESASSSRIMGIRMGGQGKSWRHFRESSSGKDGSGRALPAV
jgi:hypothetical protein